MCEIEDVEKIKDVYWWLKGFLVKHNDDGNNNESI